MGRWETMTRTLLTAMDRMKVDEARACSQAFQNRLIVFYHGWLANELPTSCRRRLSRRAWSTMGRFWERKHPNRGQVLRGSLVGNGSTSPTSHVQAGRQRWDDAGPGKSAIATPNVMEAAREMEDALFQDLEDWVLKEAMAHTNAWKSLQTHRTGVVGAATDRATSVHGLSVECLQ